MLLFNKIPDAVINERGPNNNTQLNYDPPLSQTFANQLKPFSGTVQSLRMISFLNAVILLNRVCVLK